MKRENEVLRRILLTGPPGVGKTTLIRKLHEHYAKRGVMVSGSITEEVRQEGERIGFKIRGLMTGEEGWLARKSLGTGPRIGSYVVYTADLERIGAASLRNAARGDAPLVLIDEVGPMEMTSLLYRRELSEIFKSAKFTIATVKYGSHYDEVEQVANVYGSKTILISKENRDVLFSQLSMLIDESIGL